METLNELKRRFGVAFKRLSAETPIAPNASECPGARRQRLDPGLNAQTRRVSKIEREYKAVRFEYIVRLLPTCRLTEPQGNFVNNGTEQEVL
jgi:hypothetical protein